MTQKEARKIMLWKGIERYRTAGGREEHHAYKEALDNYIDDMLDGDQAVSAFNSLYEISEKYRVERDEYQRAADKMAMEHKIERDALGMKIDALAKYKLPKAAVRACASVYDDHEPYYTADQMQQAYQAGRDAMPVCLWKKGWDCWETTCGNAFEINDGTPSENDMKHCCYCGGKVEEDIK